MKPEQCYVLFNRLGTALGLGFLAEKMRLIRPASPE